MKRVKSFRTVSVLLTLLLVMAFVAVAQDGTTDTGTTDTATTDAGTTDAGTTDTGTTDTATTDTGTTDAGTTDTAANDTDDVTTTDTNETDDTASNNTQVTTTTSVTTNETEQVTSANVASVVQSHNFKSLFTVDMLNQFASMFNTSGTIFVKEWYPKANHYVFVCNLETADFTPTRFSWFYGDGEKQVDISNRDTYHIYQSGGNFTVLCFGSDGSRVRGASLDIFVMNATQQARVTVANETNQTNVATNTTGCFEQCSTVCPVSVTTTQNVTTNQTNQTTVTTNETTSTTNDTQTQNASFEINLSGDQEVPPNNSTATGDATITLQDGELIISGSFSGLSSALHEVSGSSVHLHEQVEGQNGPIVFSLDVNVGSDGRSGFFTLPPTELREGQINDLLTGQYYLNIHTENYTGGEIRGQIE